MNKKQYPAKRPKNVRSVLGYRNQFKDDKKFLRYVALWAIGQKLLTIDEFTAYRKMFAEKKLTWLPSLKALATVLLSREQQANEVKMQTDANSSNYFDSIIDAREDLPASSPDTCNQHNNQPIQISEEEQSL